MKERQAGIDLVRCTGLLFVVSVHFFLYNGFYYEPQSGVGMWAADSIRWLFFSCNGIYMMLTGYLKSTQRLNRRYYRSLLTVLLGYVLAAAISIPVRHFFMGEELTFADWGLKFLNFSGCQYGWYVEMYIGLLLVSPILNLAMERLTDKRGLLWLCGTMIAVTALPSVTNLVIAPDYWVALYPLTYYVLGATVRRLQPRIPVWAGIGVALLTAMGLGLVMVLSADGSLAQGYGDFWITLIVTALFLALYRLQPGRRMSKLLQWMADGTFEGYLLSHLLDNWIYPSVPAWQTPTKYPLAYLCLTIPICIASILLGKLLHVLVTAAAAGMERVCRWISEKKKRA